MGTLAEKLEYAAEAIDDIETALRAKNSDFKNTSGKALEDYASYISDIGKNTTAAAGDILTGKTVYNPSTGDYKTGTMTNYDGKAAPRNGTSAAITDIVSNPWSSELGLGTDITFKLNFSGYVTPNTTVTQSVYGLRPEIVKAGAFMGGNGSPQGVGAITGTYTSDANATATDILSGKTAYVKGNKITGSIPSRGIYTADPSTDDIGMDSSGVYMRVPVGYYPQRGAKANYAYNYIPKTAFGDAAAGNVLSGKTFTSQNGIKVAGTIPSKGAATITPGTSNQTIAAGQYLSGAQTIAGDADLVSNNILSGKNIFGVAGSDTTVKYFYKKCSFSEGTWTGIELSNSSYKNIATSSTPSSFEFQHNLNLDLSRVKFISGTIQTDVNYYLRIKRGDNYNYFNNFSLSSSIGSHNGTASYIDIFEWYDDNDSGTLGNYAEIMVRVEKNKITMSFGNEGANLLQLRGTNPTFEFCIIYT